MTKRSSLTRRTLLGAGASIAAANVLPSGALAQTAKFRRWEITDPSMPPRVLTSYKAGITKTVIGAMLAADLKQ